MLPPKSLLLVAVVAALLASASASSPGGRGFGDDIEWRLLDEGLKEAEAKGKPAMVLVHKSWCGACKALGPKVAGSTELKELAKDFVMINVHDQEEPADNRWKPDGGYIPRVIFYDGLHGDILPQENEGGNPKYKFFYLSDQDVLASMKKVKALWETDDYRLMARSLKKEL